MDPLFPPLPENLKELSDEELSALLTEHEAAADLIDNDDEDFIKGMEADEVLAAYESGVEQIDAIKAEQQARVDAQEAYLARKAELAAKRKGDTEDEADETDEAESEELAAKAETDDGDDTDSDDPEPTEEQKVEEPEPVVASAAPVQRLRRPPAPSRDRIVVNEPVSALVAASGLQDTRAGQVLNPMTLAEAMRKEVQRRGRPTKSAYGVEERIAIASAEFQFPEDRSLRAGDPDGNAEKIRAVVPQSVPGMYGMPLSSEAMVASGGLCAPLTPLYTMPNFASEARPVRDALASFNAARGGVNVPEATYIGDITTAITVIEESEDAQGGTFATKSCQDLDCPDYTEVAVTIISHCREYGNLNARAWPEKIAHENALTMAAHARTAESYLLDRIKALSVNVTNGVETLGALIYLVDGIVKSSFGIRGRLRMDPNARFRVLLPFYAIELLMLDTVQTQFDRFRSREQIAAYLRDFKIDVSYYLDTPTTGDSQLPDSAQTAAAIDGLPNTVQWAIFPEGGFIHVDGGTLELGLVRDSTLNSTNDFQIFGESFENVARIAPQQATYWVTTDWCPTGQFPPAGTARTCE